MPAAAALATCIQPIAAVAAPIRLGIDAVDAIALIVVALIAIAAFAYVEYGCGEPAGDYGLHW